MSLDLYVSTVLTMMARSDEIYLLDLPSATNRTASCSRLVRIVVRELGTDGAETSITKHATCAIRPRRSISGKRFSIQRATPDRLGNCPVTSILDMRWPEAKTFSQRGATFSAMFPSISSNL